MATVLELPFEKQLNEWSCGAAALAMVYRSLGIERGQLPIWAAIRRISRRGFYCARAQALAADAIQSGLHAMVIQVRDPWVVLERCMQHSVRAIINHVPNSDSGGGHYSVLTAFNDEQAALHDPSLGPNRILSRSEFLQLWNPRAPTTEIVNQVLVAISDSATVLDQCPLCDGKASDRVTCKSCSRPVVLQPLAILGCLTDSCPMRAWEQFFCPWCDHHWSSSSGKPKPWPQ